MKPLRLVWNGTALRVVSMVPEKLRLVVGAVGGFAVILVGAFASTETPNNSRKDRAVSLFGLCVFIFILYLTSHNRKKIVWRTVIVGMVAQFIIALFVLRTEVGYDIFAFVSGLARDLLGFSSDGLAFLTSDNAASTGWFLTGVIPAIIFFVSVVQLVSRLIEDFSIHQC